MVRGRADEGRLVAREVEARDEVGRDLLDVFFPFLPPARAPLGAQVVFQEAYPKGNTDFSALLTKIKATNADVIAAATYFDDAVALTRQMRELNVSPSLHIPAEGIVAAGIAWFIIDPLAPNWKVQVTSLGQRRYAVELTMKRFITGGEGESAAVVRRTADKLLREGGFNQYAILEYSEGIESRVPIAQRVAHAVVEVL